MYILEGVVTWGISCLGMRPAIEHEQFDAVEWHARISTLNAEPPPAVSVVSMNHSEKICNRSYRVPP